MRKLIKWFGLFIALLIIIAVIPIFTPDEAYLPEAEQWLKHANHTNAIPENENRFTAMAGFNVAAEKNMLSEGSRLITKTNALLSLENSDKTIQEGIYQDWTTPELTMSDTTSNQLHEIFTGDPAQWLKQNLQPYQSLIHENRVLLARFRSIMGMDQYSNTLMPNSSLHGPNLSGFISTAQLDNLAIIYEFIYQDRQNAAKRLEQSITFSKLMMRQASSLLEHARATTLLSNNVYTYQLLLDHRPSTDGLDFTIAQLTAQEKSLLAAYQREFASLSTQLHNMLETPASERIIKANPIGPETQAPSFTESLILKAYLKPRKMENRTLQRFMHTLAQQNLPLKDRIKQNSEASLPQASWWDIYQDPIGYVLTGISMPSSSNIYIDRIDHVDAEIWLTNLKKEIYANTVTNNAIDDFIQTKNTDFNPGYTGATLSWDNNRQTMSFRVPDFTHTDVPVIKLIRSTLFKGKLLQRCQSDQFPKNLVVIDDDQQRVVWCFRGKVLINMSRKVIRPWTKGDPVYPAQGE